MATAMNPFNTVARLHSDLARVIEGMEALRAGLVVYAMAAEGLSGPSAARGKKPSAGQDRVKAFLDYHCRPTRGSYIRASALRKAYRLWCQLHKIRPLRGETFERRVMAAGFEYSRSRRIQGRQARTWEGLTLRPKAEKMTAPVQ